MTLGDSSPIVIQKENQSQELGSLFEALSKAQSEFPIVKKDNTASFPTKKGGRMSYSFADLASIIECTREILTKNGLCVIQTTKLSAAGMNLIVTTLGHSSGQWICGEIYIPSVDPKDAQKMGSAITYARRYAYTSILNLAQSDDDGQAAKTKPRATQQRKAPVNQAPQTTTVKPIQVDERTLPDFRVPSGKFKDKTLGEIPVKELQEYVKYCRDSGNLKKGTNGTRLVEVMELFLSKAGKDVKATPPQAPPSFNTEEKLPF